MAADRRPSAPVHGATFFRGLSISPLPVRLMGPTSHEGGSDEVHAVDPSGHHARRRGSEEWATLPGRRAEGGVRRLQGDQRDARRHPRRPDAAARDGDHRAGAGRQDADHRRPVRRDQGGARRLPASSRPTTSTPRSRWPRGSRRPAWAAPSRSARWWSGSDPRAGLPRPGERPRRADRLPRRLRPRRGSRPGGVRDRRGALAARRRPDQPRHLAGDDGAQPGDRPHPPRSHAGPEDPPAGGAGGPAGRPWTRRPFPTSGSS